MRLLAGLMAMGVAGCGLSPAEQRVTDQDRCGGYGFAPGTDAFARCMMATDHRREDQAAADHAAFLRQQAIQQRQGDDYGAAFRAKLQDPPASPPPRPTDPFVVPGGLQVSPATN